MTSRSEQSSVHAVTAPHIPQPSKTLLQLRTLSASHSAALGRQVGNALLWRLCVAPQSSVFSPDVFPLFI